MRTIVIALMLVTSLAAFTNRATAQTQKFPHDAIILDDEVYARSGPGNKPYYPTSRLRKGDHVTVIRHDPGGWFMIEPPPGSFAWVRKEFVKRQEDRGVITGDTQIVAWVGTSFGDDHYVEQRRLQPGEEVEIIGEKTLRDQRGEDKRDEVEYLRIKSPKGHFRWVPGSKVVTSDKQMAAATARARNGDPFAGENSGNRVRDPNVSPVDMNVLGANDEFADNNGVPSPRELGRRPAPTPKELDDAPLKSNAKSKEFVDVKSEFRTVADEPPGDEQQRLARIDQTLQDMLQRNTRDWDFTSIESELQELQANPATSTGAARRLASLSKYKRVKADYDDFAGIMEATSRRDAELAAAAAQRAGQPVNPNKVAPASRSQTNAPANNVKPAPLNNNHSAPGRAASPGRGPAPAIQSRPVPNGAPAKGRFGGAGIIQRSGANQPSAPKYVLVHPNGQRLAYLQGDGVDLGKYVGESMGLEGERYYRQDLKSDYMVVKALQPVKLKP